MAVIIHKIRARILLPCWDRTQGHANMNYEIPRHDDVIRWKHFPRYWPFVRGIHRWPVNFPHKNNDAELWCFLWSAPKRTAERTIGTPVIWDAIALVKACCVPGITGQNGRHFADDIFKCIFGYEKFCILIKMSLKFVPEDLIDNNPALFKIMARRRIGDKPLSEPMLTWFIDAYMRH